MECCFPNLQFAQGFKRINKEVNRQVHEEKYRVVFVTNIESVPCWVIYFLFRMSCLFFFHEFNLHLNYFVRKIIIKNVSREITIWSTIQSFLQKNISYPLYENYSKALYNSHCNISMFIHIYCKYEYWAESWLVNTCLYKWINCDYMYKYLTFHLLNLLNGHPSFETATIDSENFNVC